MIVMLVPEVCCVKLNGSKINTEAVSCFKTASLVLVIAGVIITSCQLDTSWGHLSHI